MDKISHWLPFWENFFKVIRITIFMIDSLTHWNIEMIITFKAFYVQWSNVLQKLPCTLQMMQCLSLNTKQVLLQIFVSWSGRIKVLESLKILLSLYMVSISKFYHLVFLSNPTLYMASSGCTATHLFIK